MFLTKLYKCKEICIKTYTVFQLGRVKKFLLLIWRVLGARILLSAESIIRALLTLFVFFPLSFLQCFFILILFTRPYQSRMIFSIELLTIGGVSYSSVEISGSAGFEPLTLGGSDPVKEPIYLDKENKYYPWWCCMGYFA